MRTAHEIEALLRQVTPAQVRYLRATITQDWRGLGRGCWRTVEALCARGLMLGVHELAGPREVLRWRMPALVEEVFVRLYPLDAPRAHPHGAPDA